MKTLNTKSTEPRKSRVRVRDGRRTVHNGSEIDDRRKIDGSEADGDEVKDDEVGKKFQKTSKSKNLFKSKKTVGFSDFFIPKAKLAFTKLRQVFFKASILYYFDLETHIQIEMEHQAILLVESSVS